MSLAHATLMFERDSSASPQQLFGAYRDLQLREVWSAPSDTTAVEILECDFRTGGKERTRCGSKDDLRWRTEVTYHAVEDDRRIVFTEVLFEGQTALTVGLVSFEFEPSAEGGTRLVVVDQVTSFVGDEAIGGHRQGYEASLDAFVKLQ